VSANKYDIEGQPEIWSSKPEVLISPKVWHVSSKFQEHYANLSLGDFNNDRQPEMAVDTGNTYISEIMKDIIKIPTINLGFTTIESSKKMSASDCNSDRQPEIAIRPRKPEVLISPEL